MSSLRNVIYQFWAGNADMTGDRLKCYTESKDVFGVKTELITPDNLSDYVVRGHPIHKAYPYLSPNHKSDYVRCYLLRFHGGGYADIRRYSRENNWSEQFELLANTAYADIVGEPENARWAAFPTYRDEEHASRLVICGYLIGKADTPFTRMWYDRIIQYLDVMYPLIRENPSPDSRSAQGYPIPHFGLMGFPFHYTCYKITGVRPNAVLRSLRSGRTNDRYR